MLFAAPFLQAALTLTAASTFRPVRRWIAGGLGNALIALATVTGGLEFLRTLIHG
jgi:hypothetical protein